MRERKRVTFECKSPSRTQQQFKDEVDVNKIMKRFKKTANADFLSRFNGYVGGEFGDFSEVPDYRTAIEQVRQAEEMFIRLPAVVRARFEHDPATFLDFVNNPKNGDELVKLGLANAKPVEAQPKVTEAQPLK